MVGPMMLMKLMHWKQLKKTRMKNDKTSHDQSYQGSSTETVVKIENEDLNDTRNQCRICLNVGYIPIYGNESSDDVSTELINFTGLSIHLEDEYPKYLCDSCNSLLDNAITLKKLARQSDQLLRQPSPKLLKTKEENEQSDDNVNYDDDSNDQMWDYEDHKSLLDYISHRGNRKPKEKSDFKYNCKRCDLTFNSFEEYSEHRLSQEHENIKKKCPVCNKTYTSVYIKKHMILHEGVKPFMCDICGKSFSIQGHFNRHRMTHFYSLPFKCSLCPYRGRFTESLKMHMRTHTGDKPYQCAECPSRFISKSNLNKHAQTHKAEHDFKCESCGRGFYTKRSLELHFKVDHAGIKDHICNICGKAFGYRKQMMKHQLKVHKREKLRSGRMPLYLQVDTGRVRSENVEPTST